MNDKDIMEGILLTTKGVCDLYMQLFILRLAF